MAGGSPSAPPLAHYPDAIVSRRRCGPGRHPASGSSASGRAPGSGRQLRRARPARLRPPSVEGGWIGCDPPEPGTDAAWVVVRTPGQREAWVAAHGDAPRVHPARSGLTDLDVRSPGAASSTTGRWPAASPTARRRVGVSNVFLGRAQGWPEVTGAVATCFPPGLQLVGWEFGRGPRTRRSPVDWTVPGSQRGSCSGSPELGRSRVSLERPSSRTVEALSSPHAVAPGGVRGGIHAAWPCTVGFSTLLVACGPEPVPCSP